VTSPAVDPDAKPRTLAIDCGGSGLKAAVLDGDGEMVTPRLRVATPYPCPPATMVATLVDLVAPLAPYDRVSVGFPGMVRHGQVLTTPHYVTEAGPFTPEVPALVEAWRGYDIEAALGAALECPTRVANDAEVQGSAAIIGKGLELVVTLGTGVGCAVFDEGVLLPHLELSQAPFRKGQTFDQQLGNHARKRVGSQAWNKRVHKAVNALRPVFVWDRLYVGGGNARHITVDLGDDVTYVDNEAGILGGIMLWETPRR
jgi:polyphosphate glucokinase